MKTNPIVNEIQRTKDGLAREAGYDTHRFFDELRRWSETHPHPGPILRNAEELHRFAANEDQRKREEFLALHEKPPKK